MVATRIIATIIARFLQRGFELKFVILVLDAIFFNGTLIYVTPHARSKNTICEFKSLAAKVVTM